MKKIIFLGLSTITLSGCFGSDLPKCGDSDTRELIAQIVKDNDYKFIDLKNVNETGFNKESEIRLCSAELLTTAGSEMSEYHIRWDNKKKSIFVVEFVD